jgi:hypothetical protein
VGLDEGSDAALSFPDESVDPASYLIVGKQGKEPLDLIDPGCADIPSQGAAMLRGPRRQGPGTFVHQRATARYNRRFRC